MEALEFLNAILMFFLKHRESVFSLTLSSEMAVSFHLKISKRNRPQLEANAWHGIIQMQRLVWWSCKNGEKDLVMRDTRQLFNHRWHPQVHLQFRWTCCRFIVESPAHNVPHTVCLLSNNLTSDGKPTVSELRLPFLLVRYKKLQKWNG